MSQRIIVADDNQDLRNSIVSILTEEGYEVSQAENGREVLKLINSSEPYHLLITDLSMPDVEGLELIRTLTKSHPDLPIVAISGSFEGRFLGVAEQFGVRGTLQKPFKRRPLLDLVNSALATTSHIP